MKVPAVLGILLCTHGLLTGYCVDGVSACGELSIDDATVHTTLTTTPDFNRTYQCATGYALDPFDYTNKTFFITCESDNAWSGIQNCSVINCGEPTDNVTSATKVSAGTLYQNEVNYTCHEGFSTNKDDHTENTFSTRCKEDGRWSTVNTCVLIDCGQPNDVTNATKVSDGTLYQAEVNYTCNEGYSTDKDDYTQNTFSEHCTQNGSWSALGECVVIDCGPLTIDHAAIIGSATTYGESRNVSCDSGFSTIQFSEGPSFKPSCDKYGNWINVQKCLPIDCGDSFELTRAYRSDDVDDKRHATIMCEPGYATHELHEDLNYQVLKCLETREWSIIRPCLQIDCRDILINSVRMTEGDSLYGNSTFTCISGYSLNSSDTADNTFIAECNATRNWSGLKDCVRVTCGNASNEVGNSSLVVQAGTLFEDSATYECNYGFALDPLAADQTYHLTCTASGDWSSPASDEICEPIDCEAPVLEHVNVTYDATLLRQNASFTCHEGYAVNPNDHTNNSFDCMCKSNAEWDCTLTCQPIECGEPTVENAQRVSGSTEYAGHLVYRCNTGYAVDPLSHGFISFAPMCESNGEWSSLFNCSLMDCGEPNDIDNATKVSDGTLYQAEVNYTCNEGYSMDKDDYTQNTFSEHCTEDGSWSALHTCVIIDCGVIENTTANYVTTYGSSTEITCLTGYSKNEADYTQNTFTPNCESNGTWSGLESCVLVECPQITVSSDVYWELTDAFRDFVIGTKYNQYAVFKCIEGYSFDENVVGKIYAVLQCSNHGNWPPLPDPCDPLNCEEPAPLTNATRETSDTNYNATANTYSARIKVNCDTGFSVNESDHDDNWYEATCNSSRMWDELRVCVPINCGDPEIDNGNLTTNSSPYYGGDATIDCDIGYSTVESNFTLDTFDLTCTLDRTWDTHAASCVPVNCSTPHEDPNADLVISTFVYESDAVYTCHEGYAYNTTDIDNTTYTWTCGFNGTWGPWWATSLICERINCWVISPVMNADMPASTDFNDTATIECIPDYSTNRSNHALNSFQSTCQSNGTWDVLRECVLLECGVPDSSGMEWNLINYTDTTAGGLAHFHCNEGFSKDATDVTQVNFTATCDGTGIWNGADRCVRLDCGQPNEADGNFVLDPPHGSTETDSHREVKCITGYAVHEYFARRTTKTIVCQNDRSWRNVEPYSDLSLNCREISCLASPIDHASTSSSTTNYEDSADFTCDDGYSLNEFNTSQNEFSAICAIDGNWNGSQVCVRVNCSEPPVVENAVSTGDAWLYEDNVNYTCNEGFSTDPENHTENTFSVECLPTGAWSAHQQCVRVDCGTVDAAQTQNLTTFNNTPTFTCITGYSITPINPANNEFSPTCMSNRTWSGLETCLRVDCESPPEMQNATVTFANTVYEATANYTCDQGYSIDSETAGSHPDLISCLSNAEWSTSAYPCVRIQCGEPSSVTTATYTKTGILYEDKATYTCVTGYSLHATTPDNNTFEATCNGTGTWASDAAYMCIKVDCESPEAVENASHITTGTTFEETFSYTCNPGYSQNPTDHNDKSFSITCRSNATWSPSSHCERIDCEAPNTVDNARYVTNSGTKYNDIASYTCNTGYSLAANDINDNSFQIKCLNNRQWEQTSNCIKIDCEDPHDVSLASKEFIGTLYEDKVNYTCHTGYSVTPSDWKMNSFDATCLASRTWSTTPDCTRVDCGEPIDVQNARKIFVNGETLYDDIVTYNCDTGYSLNPTDHLDKEFTSMCQDNNEWTFLETCKLIDCEAPPIVANADRVGTRSLWPNEVHYTCKVGYSTDVFDHTERKFSSQCQDERTWSTVKTCNKIDCKAPPELSNAKIVTTSPRTLHGAKVDYKCKPGYALIDTDHKDNEFYSKCSDDRLWTRTTSPCKRVSCGKAKKMEHAKMEHAKNPEEETKFEFGDEVLYKCHVGRTYGTKERVTATCLANGTWTSIPKGCFDKNTRKALSQPAKEPKGERRQFNDEPAKGPEKQTEKEGGGAGLGVGLFFLGVVLTAGVVLAAVGYKRYKKKKATTEV